MTPQCKLPLHDYRVHFAVLSKTPNEWLLVLRFLQGVRVVSVWLNGITRSSYATSVGGLADPYQIGGIGPHHGSHIYFLLVLYAMIRDMEELLQWGGEEWLAIAGSIRIPSSSKRTESNSPDKHTLAWSMFYGLLSMICCSACCTSFLARTTTH